MARTYVHVPQTDLQLVTQQLEAFSDLLSSEAMSKPSIHISTGKVCHTRTVSAMQELHPV